MQNRCRKALWLGRGSGCMTRRAQRNRSRPQELIRWTCASPLTDGRECRRASMRRCRWCRWCSLGAVGAEWIGNAVGRENLAENAPRDNAAEKRSGREQEIVFVGKLRHEVADGNRDGGVRLLRLQV